MDNIYEKGRGKGKGRFSHKKYFIIKGLNLAKQNLSKSIQVWGKTNFGVKAKVKVAYIIRKRGNK